MAAVTYGLHQSRVSMIGAMHHTLQQVECSLNKSSFSVISAVHHSLQQETLGVQLQMVLAHVVCLLLPAPAASCDAADSEGELPHHTTSGSDTQAVFRAYAAVSDAQPTHGSPSVGLLHTSAGIGRTDPCCQCCALMAQECK
ncbi:hypothetical protein NDU88_004771 [Pleurodeles waltl]|uniref:Uncharacterized protein n=1 Tax=Pleurodeles waltl TaxID=8319 RepID=A0AAV7WA23_PLEWA|nr:hypothetical protein NDU88_004771 [Pleurodeles waltl]